MTEATLPRPQRPQRPPRTDTVLADPRIVAAVARLGASPVRSAVRDAQSRVRRGELAAVDVPDAALAALPPTASGLRPVINATGVVLHTNLGRAPLSAAAREAVAAAAGATNVEFDLATGRRARRGAAALAALAAAVPDAEAVHVVNNNAAALVLAATVLAAGREIVVSRGELVEIGDGFRLPDLLESTGARLREVGTTNRTVLADYARAVGAATGFVLKVHPSNYTISGYTADVGIPELATLGVPVVYDIGSGLLAADRAVPGEPDARTSLRAGADLVTASGDKLLGGPQAGLLLGRRALVERLARHPLARALRVDKLTLAALEATLRGPAPPVWSALRADAGVLRERAEQIAAALRPVGLPVTVESTSGVIGGGAAPGLTLDGWAVCLPEACAARLLAADPPVLARVERGRCLVDVRTVPPADDAVLTAAILAASA